MLVASKPGLVEADLPRPEPFSLDRLVHDPSLVDSSRIVAVVAHPDDEVLGCGIFLSRHGGARVVHVTDGAPADGRDAARLGFASPADYARVRRGEVEAAMRLAGLDRTGLRCLGVADQAAAHGLRTLAQRLIPLLRGADVVLTHAYEGGHPDHDATAYAVHAALRPLGGDGPVLVEMPFYRAAPEGWVRQAFRPEPGAGPEVALHPTDDERRLKRRMLDAHASQAAVLADFPPGPERFRLAPPYDFDAAPNGGLVLYGRYAWGTSPAQWAERVRAALDAAPGA